MEELVSITIKISAKVKKRLEEMAQERNKTVSEVAQEIFEAAMLKNSSK